MATEKIKRVFAEIIVLSSISLNLKNLLPTNLHLKRNLSSQMFSHTFFKGLHLLNLDLTKQDNKRINMN